MKLLVVASNPMEFSGILAHASPAPTVQVEVKWARAVQLGGHSLLLVAHGAGVKRAAAASAAGLKAFSADALVSVGFCGAVIPELAIADIVVASDVTMDDVRYAATPVSSPRPHTQAVVRTHSRVAQSVEERRRLRSTGASAVDMEAAAVAECAGRHSLPFYCVKVVTDLAGETMANDFNRALREDGSFDTIILLRGMVRHPFARLPELLRLRNRATRAAGALGDFFADCRF